MMSIVALLLIGLAAGFIASRVVRGRGFGVVGNLVIGVLGSLVGGSLFEMVGMTPDTLVGTLFAAVLGACLLLVAAGLLRKA